MYSVPSQHVQLATKLSRFVTKSLQTLILKQRRKGDLRVACSLKERKGWMTGPAGDLSMQIRGWPTLD